MEEFLEPLGISQYRLAKEACVCHHTHQQRSSSEQSGRLRQTPRSDSQRFFGTTERFWLNLQVQQGFEIEKDQSYERPLSAT